jgi:hypothetical protein
MNPTRAARWVALGAVIAVAPGLGSAGPAGAAQSVHIVAETSFSSPVAPFESDLSGCSEGTVENGRFTAPETAGLGTFSGLKEFTCGEVVDGVVTDPVGGFTVQLTAHFPLGPGSLGKWSVVSSWGSVDGLRASGSLVGVGSDNGILDIYDGTIRAGR